MGFVLLIGLCILYSLFVKNSPFIYQQPSIDKIFTIIRHRHSTKLTPNLFNHFNLIDHKLVIYNRIPKTGSTSLINLVYKLLNVKRLIHVIHLNISNNGHYLNRFNQLSLVHNLTYWISMQPLMIHGHFAYLDFKQYGSSIDPIYINMVRDPLKRLISYYYFLRYGDDYHPNIVRKRMLDEAKQNETFDECVTYLQDHENNMGASDDDCDPKHLWIQVPFFCGQAEYCRIPGNPEAVQTAKRHVTEKYLLVGLTERFNESVYLLEHLLPTFFQGAYNLLAENDGWHLRRTRSTKHKISETTLNFFEQNSVWQAEQAFYTFVTLEFKSILNTVRKREKRNRKFDKWNSEPRDFKQSMVFDKIRPSLSD